MKNFLRRIAGFFWSWGFLKFVLWTITLVVLLYAEEDWRGARTWAATKAKWEAQGETFDIQRLAPRPVPADENLAALPLFKMEPDPDSNPHFHGYLAPLALRKAFFWDWKNTNLPGGGNWEQGKLAESEKNRTLVATAYTQAFKGAPSTMDSFAQFSALVPAVGDLRNAAADHPFCQFNLIYYSDYSGAASTVNLLTSQIVLSRFLTADAVLALDTKRPDIALADILAQAKLMSGTCREPTLVAGLVTMGMQAINLSAIYQGLATHAWNDQQIAQLLKQMRSVDFLSSFKNALRGDPCISIAILDRMKTQRSRLISELHPQAATVPPTPTQPRDLTPFIWPVGWIDLLKARSANFDLAASRLVDLQNRMLSPRSIDQFMADIEKRRGDNASSLFSFWKNLFGVSVGPINSAAQKFALAQVRLDETRIACALERYHLTHQAYPATLEELAPTYIDAVPHDIINGQPFHYQARADGTFHLYSVGWNETDDGGAFAFKKDNPKAIDYESGDWPWPAVK